MFFFQHDLADIVVPANDHAFIDMLWADWSPGYDAGTDLPHVKACLAEPDHLAAALGYYRATLGDGARTADYDAIEASGGVQLTRPTLYLHGRDDGCMGVETAEQTRESCPWVDVEIVDDAGHFLQLEQPRRVNDLILEFVTARS